MRKFLLTLLLLPFLALAPSKPSLDQLQGTTGQFITVLSEKETNLCSAVAVGLDQWLTVAHCLVNDSSTIAGKPATMLKIDKSNDLMLMSAPTKLLASVARSEPRLGDAVTVMGWPDGWNFEEPLLFFGHVQARGQKIAVEDVPEHEVNFFHEGGGQGMSGGPIFSEAGEIIGVMEANARYPSISVASPTVKVIRKFLGLK